MSDDLLALLLFLSALVSVLVLASMFSDRDRPVPTWAQFLGVTGEDE